MKKNNNVVKSFPTFPQIAGKVDGQIMKFMEDWLANESEVLSIEKIIPHQADTADGLEQVVLVVFKREYN